VDVAQGDDVVARARRALELELDRLATARGLDAVDLVELLDPALHLGGVRGARLELLDELDFLGQHGLLALVLRLALLLAERALLVVEVQIARIGNELPPSISTTLPMMRFMKARSCDVISKAPS
jgi:hypothetical protein